MKSGMFSMRSYVRACMFTYVFMCVCVCMHVGWGVVGRDKKGGKEGRSVTWGYEGNK